MDEVLCAAWLVLVAGCRDPQRGHVAPDSTTPSVAGETRGETGGRATVDDGRPPAELGPEAILVQIDFEPNGSLVPRRNTYDRHGRVPAVTLYRDGTLIFETPFAGKFEVRDSWQVLMRRIGARRASDIHHRVLELGVAELPEQREWCDPNPPEEQIGTIHSPYLVLLVRTASGTARTRMHTSCDPAPDDPVHLTETELSRLAVASEDAVVYRPDRASVYLVPRRADAVEQWPLSLALFDAAMDRDHSLVVVEGRELDRLIAAVGSNNGGARLGAGDRTLFVDVVPWLPGEDHNAAIARDLLRLTLP